MCTHGAEGLGRARFLALGRAAWLQPGVVRANNAEGILHLLHGTHGLRLQPGWFSPTRLAQLPDSGHHMDWREPLTRRHAELSLLVDLGLRTRVASACRD